MDRAHLVQLASDVASTDFGVARGAATQLRLQLTPDKLAAIVDDEAQAAVLAELLNAALDAGDEAVTGVIGSILHTALVPAKDAATQPASNAHVAATSTPPWQPLSLLLRPHAWPIIDYVLRLCARDELASRGNAQSLLVAVLRCTDGHARADAVGAALVKHFCNDKLPRLFDCDAAASDENALVCHYLDRHARPLLDYLFTATVAAFDTDDTLLLVNYLVVCGVVGRHTCVPDTLTRHVDAIIAGYTHECDDAARVRDGGCQGDSGDGAVVDATLFAFVCRYCGIVLRGHEDNARRYAVTWVPQLMHWVYQLAAAVTATRSATATSAAVSRTTLHRHVDAADAVCDVLAAASSTQGGWAVVRAHIDARTLQTLLQQSGMDTLRLSVLQLLDAVLASGVASVDELRALLTAPLVRDVWQLHRSPDEGLQLAVWQLIAALVRAPALRASVTALCASYLSSQANDHVTTAAVRSCQLRVASMLLSVTDIPASMRPALERFVRRGVYPAGSSGISAMRHD